MATLENLTINKINAAIFILSQNTDVRRTYLKTTLYFLFRNFNAEYKYPVIIFHEGDFTPDAQTEIINGIRKSCRHLVTFRALDADDFKTPDHIDKDKLKRCIATNPAPYWRNEAYRNMCRWGLIHMPKYAAGYDYIMRIDDDSFIEETICSVINSFNALLIPLSFESSFDTFSTSSKSSIFSSISSF